MTQMSDLGGPTRARLCANLAKSWRGTHLARTVHDSCLPVGILATLAPLVLIGCVIPPSLDVEKQDAGVNSPPAIMAVNNDNGALAEPGPVTVNVGRTAGSLSLQLNDTDLSDGL